MLELKHKNVEPRFELVLGDTDVTDLSSVKELPNLKIEIDRD